MIKNKTCRSRNFCKGCFMRSFFLAALVAASAGVSAPAMAASIVNADNSVTLESNDAFSWTFDYNGFTSNGGASVPGLTSRITFNFTGTTANGYQFTYTLENTSGAPIDASRVVGFGFNTNPNLTSATAGNGDLFDVVASGPQPNGLAPLEFCLKGSGGANNCSGGGGEGVDLGQSTTGSFTLNFANLPATLTLSDFSVRYQGIDSAQLGIEGGSASGVPGIPEPATWAMMIGGFGLVGAAMRRRQRTAIAYA